MSNHLTKAERDKIAELVTTKWQSMHNGEISRLKNVLDIWEHVNSTGGASGGGGLTNGEDYFSLGAFWDTSLNGGDALLHATIPDAIYDVRVEAMPAQAGVTLTFRSDGDIVTFTTLGGIADELVVREMKGVRIHQNLFSVTANVIGVVRRLRVILTKVADVVE